jgi:hypothetical protein
VALSSETIAVADEAREISPVTRRDIFDFLRAEPDPWWGRLTETAFLGQIYDLDALPSADPRHATAAEDIIRHREANFDWDDHWVFDDPPDGRGSGWTAGTAAWAGIDMTSQSSRPASSSDGCTTMPASVIRFLMRSRRWVESA